MRLSPSLFSTPRMKALQVPTRLMGARDGATLERLVCFEQQHDRAPLVPNALESEPTRAPELVTDHMPVSKQC
jgi:hypothetical protein